MAPLSFSIVIPTFQRRDVVCDAVRALSAVDYEGPLELIVVVDGSTDGTAAALANVKCPFPVRVVEQPNAGAASARNAGAALASGEVLLFLDDDMMAAPDLVEQHARSHASGADAVLGHVPLDPKSPPCFLSEAAGRWAADRQQQLRDGRELGLFDLLTGQLSVKRSLFEALGGFDTAFTAGGSFGNEDLDFGLRLLDRGRVVFNPDAVSRQRYVVTPNQYLEQWEDAGRADVAFARKHPAHARELFELHGSKRWLHRLLLRPIAASSALSRTARAIALRLAARERLGPLARRYFAAARDIVYWSAVREAGGIPSGRTALILCYHAIADLSSDPVLSNYGVPPRQFIAQLDRLLSRGFTFIRPDELASFVESEGLLPRKAILLTFDDCYEEFSDIARTVLKPRGIQPIAFAVARLATNVWDQAIGAHALRLLNGPGLRELLQNGVEIGCHSRTHRSLPGLNESELLGETAGAADDLVADRLPRPRFFAYPYGEHDRRARETLKAAGFVAAFGLSPAVASTVSDRFALPRVEILAADGSWRFWLKTAMPRLSGLLNARAAILGRVAGLKSRVLARS